MSSIVGQYPGAENVYRRERISKSFASHRRTSGRKIFPRRTPKPQTPAIDWYGE